MRHLEVNKGAAPADALFPYVVEDERLGESALGHRVNDLLQLRTRQAALFESHQRRIFSIVAYRALAEDLSR